MRVVAPFNTTTTTTPWRTMCVASDATHLVCKLRPRVSRFDLVRPGKVGLKKVEECIVGVGRHAWVTHKQRPGALEACSQLSALLDKRCWQRLAWRMR